MKEKFEQIIDTVDFQTFKTIEFFDTFFDCLLFKYTAASGIDLIFHRL